MKRRYIIIALTLLLDAFLACTPFISATAPIWHREDPVRFFGTLASLVAIEFAILTAALSFLALDASADLHVQVSQLDSKLPPVVVRRLRDFQFYSQFRAAVEDAKNSVRICYFAPYPPSEVRYPDRDKYYREILDLMKKKQNVSFKRIIRDSAPNQLWIASLINDLDGRPNNDVAVLRQDLPAEHPMPLALSVQVVDQDKAWLVAIDTHEREGEFRDIYIESSDVALAMAGYFDRLWTKSATVLDRGRITQDGRELLDRIQALGAPNGS
jgi:hypothetical protein